MTQEHDPFPTYCPYCASENLSNPGGWVCGHGHYRWCKDCEREFYVEDAENE